MRQKNFCIQFTAQIAAWFSERGATTTKIEKRKPRLHHGIGRKCWLRPLKQFLFFPLKLVDGLIKHVEDANTGLIVLLFVANINLSCEI